MLRNVAILTIVLVPTLAFAQDRAQITMQTLQAQSQALTGANQLCQMDVAELRTQLEEAKAQLAKARSAEQQK